MGIYTTEMEASSTILSSEKGEASRTFPAMLLGSVLWEFYANNHNHYNFKSAKDIWREGGGVCELQDPCHPSLSL